MGTKTGRPRIGLIVNPVAGMGGSVGLKGTDGTAYERAVALGARPVAPSRTATFLDHLEPADAVRFLAAPGPMGADSLRAAGIDCTVVGELDGPTTPADTRRIAVAMRELGIDLIVAVGGDGTLRDVCRAIDSAVPVVAVPAGVKVYSSVFAVNPRAAARMVGRFVQGAGCIEAEVLDIDEVAYRDGRLEAAPYGYLLVPDVADLVQPGKESSARDGAASRIEAAAAVAEQMVADRLYLLGPGTTVRAITDELGLPKTLLGIDAVRNGKSLGLDLNEDQILQLLARFPDAGIVVTPLGGNGFVLGRGNRQLTPAVIRAVGVDRLMVVAARGKLTGLKCLRVDTGDSELDAQLGGYREVVTGTGHTRLMRVA